MSFLFFIKSTIKHSKFVTVELVNLLKMDLSEQLKKLFPDHEVSNEPEIIKETDGATNVVVGLIEAVEVSKFGTE